MGLNIPVSKNLPLLKIILILDENTFFSDDNPMRLAIRHWFYLAGRMQHQFEDTQCGSPFVVNESIPCLITRLSNCRSFSVHTGTSNANSMGRSVKNPFFRSEPHKR